MNSPVWICVGKKRTWITRPNLRIPIEKSWPVPGNTCYGEEFEKICERYLEIYPLRSWDQKFWVTRHSFKADDWSSDIDAYIAVLPVKVIYGNESISWTLQNPWTPWTTKNAWLVTDESLLKKYTRERLHNPRDRVFNSLWDIAKEMTLKDGIDSFKEEN